ncbi:hypothetical protein COU37_00850 [Candidatus Micrarchaeota archaeon CG10_big_fil_rev_8_21_14_0_10_45_29]|nr:MAG: hypothetical protein COU37_00850 [Candidatus Micrarchaeota archaeon CG10_big_fil_rev_8_21_14_0_10_45_29]
MLIKILCGEKMSKQKIIMNENTRLPQVQTAGDRIKTFSNKLLENKKVIAAGAGAGLVVGLTYAFVRSVDKSFEKAIKK